jgi:hypothetical protein
MNKHLYKKKFDISITADNFRQLVIYGQIEKLLMIFIIQSN